MKILLITPNSTDPLAFYRSTGPLSRMRKDYSDFEYQDEKNISWSTIAGCDVAFMQRPFEPEHVLLAQICRKWNVPLVIDYDDWLLDLPESNLAVDAFNNARNNVMELCKLANHVIVSTEKLKELLTRIDVTNVTVIPNAYNAKLFPYRRHQMDRSKIFLWRGGNSHLEDLLSVQAGYQELMKKYPDWQFGFIAQHPWMFERAPNLHFIGGQGVVEYFKLIHDMCPAIMSHPLKRSDFNESKSMCSWIEATHARATFVGPDFEEYKRPGLINYKADDSESFFNTCSDLMTNVDKLVPNMLLSEQEILTNLELGNVNKLRYEVFKSFC